MVAENPLEFQKSISKELTTTKDRVRNLIGSKHWGEEGRYKEAVLKNMISRFLPSNLSLGTGFIKSKEHISTQIDVIIYNNNFPVFFQEGDFVILSQKSVKGVIEVKSNIRKSGKNGIKAVSEKFCDSISMFEEIKNNDNIFKGIFAYESNVELEGNNLRTALNESKGLVNHLSLGEEKFIKFRPEGTNPVLTGEDFLSKQYRIYKLQSLGFSYFIGNLINTLCETTSGEAWFYFPIEHSVGKEIYCVDTVVINE